MAVTVLSFSREIVPSVSVGEQVECLAVHRKRCTQFLRWGSKGAKCCKGDSCSKLNPILCPASHDLLCTNKGCDYKVHVSKCKRKTRQPSRAADKVRESVGGSHPSSTSQAGGKGGQQRGDCRTCS